MKNDVSADWVKKNSEKLKNIYSYAVVHKYNIKSEIDVLEVLKATYPQEATIENAKTFSKMLQLFSLKFKKSMRSKLED